MNHTKRIRAVSGAVTVVICAVIFFFSAQQGSASDEMSLSMTSILFDNFELILFLNVFVRKAAHMAEFAALAIPCRFFVSTFGLKKRVLTELIPFAFAALYAASDEFHQLFVPGRSGQLSDVMIDTLGAFLGLVALNLLLYLLKKRKERRSAGKTAQRPEGTGKE